VTVFGELRRERHRLSGGEHGAAATFDEVMVPALTLMKIDRRKGALEPARERYIYGHARRIVEEEQQRLAGGAG